MAKINCSACEDLRQTDPNLIVNGFGDDECTSLMNDTGLVASSGNDDCTDLNNLNDCLVGNMEAEADMYEVCDWKTFMKQFIPNVWTTLKGIICAICGIWKNIHNINEQLATICPSIDNILALIRGNLPKIHDGYFTDNFKNNITVSIFPSGSPYTPSKEKLVPAFCADILQGSGCNASKNLGRYTLIEYYKDNIYPYGASFRIDNPIAEGTVIGIVPRSAVGVEDMSIERWRDLLANRHIWEWFVLNGDTLFYVETIGYVHINGVALNSEYAVYGEDNMVILAGPYVGNSRTGGVGSIGTKVHSYDA